MVMAFTDSPKSIHVISSIYRTTNSLKKSLYPFFLFLCITGMKSAHNKNCSRKKVSYLIFAFIILVFIPCLLFIIISEIFWITILVEKKTEASLLFVIFIQISAYISLYRSRYQIRSILKNLTRISRNLNHAYYTQRIRRMVSFYCVFFTAMNMILIALFFCNSRKDIQLRITCSSFTFLAIPNIQEYCILIRNATMLLVPLVFGTMMYSLAGYYSFLCISLKSLFVELSQQLNSSTLNQNCCRLLHIYRNINNQMTSFDNCFSYSAFVAVLSGMVGLFRTSYALIFFKRAELFQDFYSCIAGANYLCFLVIVILTASEAVQSATTAREIALSLPGRIPSRYQELKVLIRKDLRLDVKLTLWKTYAIERSLLISALGSLLTYGILVATLGNINS